VPAPARPATVGSVNADLSPTNENSNRRHPAKLRRGESERRDIHSLHQMANAHAHRTSGICTTLLPNYFLTERLPYLHTVYVPNIGRRHATKFSSRGTNIPPVPPSPSIAKTKSGIVKGSNVLQYVFLFGELLALTLLPTLCKPAPEQ
jgi:hypothetical protein